MSDIVSVVVFSPESAVRDALKEALEEKLRPSLALEPVQTLSRAVDRILSRRPTMAFIDISGETEEALRTALSLHAGSPETRLIGLYNPLQIPGHVVLSELFLEAMRSGFFDFLRAPISPSELERILGRVQDPASQPAAVSSGAAPGDVISLISSKGGVGKTAIAVNLAVALAAEAPGQVALVDASFDLGNTREFLGLAPEYTFYDAYLQRDRLDRDMLLGVMAKHEPSGIFLLDSPRKVEEMVGIKDEGVTQVMLSLRKAFRYVIVDTIPVLTPVLLAIGDLSQSMLVVTEGVVPALKGTHALLAILEEAGYDAQKIKIILNRYSRSEGNVELDLAAQGLGRPIDYVLPYDNRLHEAANEGVPYVSKHPGSDFGLRIAKIARDLTGVSPAQPPSSFFQKLLSR
ncbi:MAG TPA: AAA family ATPase [Planctomycetota bacterium]|nr:AAA family ATPase [Planctomycetota bacterium]